MQDEPISQDELRSMAEQACEKANGSGWKTMADVEQQAQVEAWIEGYSAGSKRPYFRVTEQGWGTKWQAGETLAVPDPRLVWLRSMREQCHFSECDLDEVDEFINWIEKRLSDKL